MTQNVYSGSLSNDKRDDHPDSNEIRADIDQTRASVGEKIDQLQSRLDPNRLKEQAQETVQEMLNDTASSMTEYVRSHKDEMVSSIANAARRNPLPTALMGLGLGWLILESMAGNKRDDDDRRAYDRYDYERRNFSTSGSRSRFEGSSGRSQVSQGRGQYMADDYYNQYDAPDYTTSGYPTRTESRSEFQGQQDYGNGHKQGTNPLAKAADAVKDTVGDIGHEIKDRVEGVSQGITERVGDVKERLGGAVEDVRQQAGQMGGQTQRSMYRAGNQMDEWQHRARYEGQRRGQQVMRNLEDNPLTYGALALAAGAALALLLPQTRTENRYFGEMRDQVMEKGQEVMETAKSRAQEVVSEVRPELEEKARQIVSDAKEIGKEVAKDAAAELRPVVDKAVAKGKEEARNVAQEAGINPDKLTSGSSSTGSSNIGSSSTGSSNIGQAQSKTPVINRDTLRGQWSQIKGEIKSKWGQLTDDELTRVEGDYEKLVGAIQTRYGYERGRTEQEINEFFKSRKA
jgi:uncharacterized protein YjbJ (UPF0337 family)/vacuolar-type H+-ATPase subunit E/Vma4